MKKSLVVRLAFLLLTASALSGCIWWVGDDEGRHRGERERGGGERHEEHHDDRYERR